MNKLRVSFRVGLGGCALLLLLLAAGAIAAGYLIEAHHQQADRDHRLTAAAAYVQHGAPRADTTQWQRSLTAKLRALQLGASLTLAASPDGKRMLYNRSFVKYHAAQPTAVYVFPLAGGIGRSLRLELFARPLDRNRRLLVALASGLGALLVGGVLLLWGASRWLIAPLRRLSEQVDAVAGGDRVEMRARSPVREIDSVAVAISGMAATLARTAEHDARVEAEQRLLVSSIAHDLRTPLFSLRGYLDAIAAGIGNPRERLDRARDKADQIDRLITALFQYATANIDESPRLQGTDLAEAIADTATGFELAARERAVKLRVTRHAGSLVMIDRDGFARSLGNIIDNALHHTPPGGVIDIIQGEDTSGVYVQIVDDGPGIPPDLLPHIFEPLMRADDARGNHTSGTGLGLSIATRLLQYQGGTIHAINTSDRGASFTLRLPRVPRG